MELEIKEDNLSRSSQTLILTVAALQGIALYFFYRALSQDWWPIENDPVTVIIGLWLFLMPVTLILTYRRSLSSTKYWLTLVALFLLLIPIGTFFGLTHAANGMRALGFGSVVAFVVAYFIAMFWFKGSLHDGRWLPSYASLFAYSWHNFLSVSLAYLFSMLVVGVLYLWGALFRVINIDFFADLFAKEWFVIPALAISFGYAIILFRTQINAVGAVQRILRALFTLLLPILGLVAVLFVTFLPITGIDLIWQKGYGSGTILCFIFVLLFLFNAVFQDAQQQVYSPMVNRVVRLIPVALLPLAALSIYGVGVRVAEYGLTIERLWAVILTAFASGFVLLYALLALLGSETWKMRFGDANRLMAAVIGVVCFFIITPIVGLDRLSIASQINRLETGQVEPQKFDYAYLMRLGEVGHDALDELRASPLVANNTIALQRLEHAIQTNGRAYANDRFGNQELKSAFAEHLLVYPSDYFIDLDSLVGQLNLSEVEHCSAARPCALVVLNLNDDPAPERVLLTPSFDDRYQATRLEEYVPGQFHRVGHITLTLDPSKLIQAMRAEQVSAQPSLWQNVQIGDQLIRIGEPNY